MPRLMAFRLAAWRSRRLLRVLLVAALVGLAVRLAAPSPAQTTWVAVAAHRVAAGHTLTADDIRMIRLPSDSLPGAAPRTADAPLGRRTSIDLPAGLALVPSLLSSGRYAVDPPAGSVVVPVTLGGATALLIGDKIEIVPDAGCAGTSGSLAVTAVVVGWAAADDTSDGGAVDSAGTGAPDGLISGLGIGSTQSSSAVDVEPALIAASPENGRLIAAIAQSCSLGAVILP